MNQEIVKESRDKGLELAVVKAMPNDPLDIEEIPENVELVPSSGDDIIVFAKTPEQMAKAQSALTAWAKRRIQKVEAELQIAKDNLVEAKKAKIRTAGWNREVKKHEKDLNFYTKICGALEAGYCIVPDFPLNIIGVRTMETEPGDHGSQRYPMNINNEEHQELPVGEGEYVDPQPKTYKFTEIKLNDGKEEKVQLWTAEGTSLQKMDFPFRLVRPHLIKDLNKAAELKIFDAIGFLPSRRKSRDPMLVGVIENRVSKYNIKKIQFLISWWVPTADL